jgi:hypothetical protein
MIRRCTRGLGMTAAVVTSLMASTGSAQTWTGSRTTPSLTELIAIDATGDLAWPFGYEDLAGDGNSYMQPEQSIDFRTAYAVADNQTFWARGYVADDNAADGSVILFVFIDADDAVLTGGSAAATEIDAKFTDDPSPGGYEFVVEIGANEAINDIWAWDDNQQAFAPVTLNPNDNADAEAGQDDDPLDIDGAAHGYLQGMVDLSLVGLDNTCDANLFFRSVSDSGSEDGDLEVGTVAPCVPLDADGDGLPDILVPDGGCDNDDECPGGGICVDGDCVIPIPCLLDNDCGPDEFCNGDGICFPNPGGSCMDDADCGDLVCDNGTCMPCDLGSSQCGDGRVCGPGGRCVDGTPTTTGSGGAGGGGLGLNPGDNVQGGAFTCGIGPNGSARWALLIAALGAASLVGRRRNRRAGRRNPRGRR